MNVALMHEADELALAEVIRNVEDLGAPTLLMLAGDAERLADRLPAPWTAVGAMPIMAVDPADAPTTSDPRARRAEPADAEAVTGLVSDAFGMDFQHVEPVVVRVLGEDLAAAFWLLEEDGEPVSTVLAARVEDTVSLWCMATPPRFARRGHGRALLAAVLNWAAEDGAKIGLLGATPAGEPLYRATGWKVIEEWNIHLNAESVQFS
jgi:GNAT superfamily N-acetyltransferase